MEKQKVERINELARKSKLQELTEEEKAILAEAGVEIPEIEETVNEGEYEEAYASESEDGEPNE